MKRGKPDPNDMLNELSRDSVFFQRAVAGPATVPEQVGDEPAPTGEPAEPSPVPPKSMVADRGVPPVPLVPPVRPVRRKRVRHPFDMYEDQLEALRELAANDRRLGGQGSMSEMVREALDQYLPTKSDMLRDSLDRYIAELREGRR